MFGLRRTAAAVSRPSLIPSSSSATTPMLHSFGVQKDDRREIHSSTRSQELGLVNLAILGFGAFLAADKFYKPAEEWLPAETEEEKKAAAAKKQ